MKFESKHNAHEKLHEESVGLEALEERCDGAVLRCRRVWKQMCNATYPFVRSVLHCVQRHLANCRKRIASCAKAPIQLSEAHCTLCKGTLTIVRSPLQIATDVFIMQWIKKLNVAAIGKVLTLGQNLWELYTWRHKTSLPFSAHSRKMVFYR